MNKVELISLNFAYKVATGQLGLDLIRKLSNGDPDTENLSSLLRHAIQLHKLFDSKSILKNPDLILLARINLLIRSLILDYLSGTPIEAAESEVITRSQFIIVYPDLGDLTPETPGGGNGSGDFKTEFKYITADANGILQVDGTMRKSIITGDIEINGLGRSPGQFGTLIVKQDDLGGHTVSLMEGNVGQRVVINTLPRAETRLTWERYDNSVHWKSEILYAGIKPTTPPIFSIDDYRNTLDIFHSLPTEILISENGGAWQLFQGKFFIGAVDRPRGYWRAKIRGLEPDRLESLISYSNPVYAAHRGFTYTLPLILS